MDLCRRAARLALGRERLQEIESLPLPQSLKNYLQYQWLTPAEHRDTSQTTRESTAGWMKDEWKNVRTGSTEAQQKEDLYEDGYKDGGWTDSGGPGFHSKGQDSTSFFWISSCSFICFGLEINYWWWCPISVSLIQKENPSSDGTVQLSGGRDGGENNHRHLVMRIKTAPRKHTNPIPEAFLTYSQWPYHWVGYHSVYSWSPLVQVTSCRVLDV